MSGEREQVQHYPVVVVGGGPAGAAAVLYAKRAGLSVLLIDKAGFPRDKVCGDGIPMKTFNLLEELGFDEAELFTGGYRINRLNVYSPDNRVTRYGSLEADASTKSGCIPRQVFDNMLFVRAAGAADKVLSGHRLERLGDYASGRRELELRDLASGATVTVTADLVLAADGAKSPIARQTGLLKPEERHNFDGLRMYYRSSTPFEPVIHLFYDRETLPGYVWVFPVGTHQANVGIMINRKQRALTGRNVREVFFDVLKANPAVREVLKDAEPMEKVTGAPLPLGTLPGSRIADGVILIGDAAAFINPITGGGIYFAILSAKYAVEFGRVALERGDTGRPALGAYEKWWRKTILPGFVYSDRLKKWFDSERFARWFLNKSSTNPVFANFFISVYGRPLPRFTFLNPKFWAWVLFARN